MWNCFVPNAKCCCWFVFTERKSARGERFKRRESSKFVVVVFRLKTNLTFAHIDFLPETEFFVFSFIVVS